MTREELKDWLETGNSVHCDGLEEREQFFGICEELGFQRGFMSWEHQRYFYMYLSPYSRGQIHASLSETRGCCREFSSLGLGAETFEVQDPMLLYA